MYVCLSSRYETNDIWWWSGENGDVIIFKGVVQSPEIRCIYYMQTFIIKVNIYILLITELLFICYLFVCKHHIDSTARRDTAETDGCYRIFLENEQDRRTIEPICWCKLCSHGYIFIVYQIKKEIIRDYMMWKVDRYNYWMLHWHCQGGINAQINM